MAIGWEGEGEGEGCGEGDGWSKWMHRLKLSRKWKATFPRTRAGEDNRAGGTIMRKLERHRRREKS